MRAAGKAADKYMPAALGGEGASLGANPGMMSMAPWLMGGYFGGKALGFFNEGGNVMAQGAGGKGEGKVMPMEQAMAAPVGGGSTIPGNTMEINNLANQANQAIAGITALTGSDGARGGAFSGGGTTGASQGGAMLSQVQSLNAGGWVGKRAAYLNMGGMALPQAEMQAYNEMQGMTGPNPVGAEFPMPEGSPAPEAYAPANDYG